MHIVIWFSGANTGALLAIARSLAEVLSPLRDAAESLK